MEFSQCACIVLIYFRLVFKPCQALAMKEHGHRFRRHHLLREANDLIAIILDTRDYALSNPIAFGNNVSRADL